MKVLFINTVFGRGSTGRIVKDIGDRLEQEGHSYMAVYGRGEESADPHARRIGSALSVGTHALLARLTDRAGFYSSRDTRELVAFIREYDPDVIHLHNLHGYYLNIEILFHYLKQEFRGKVVWTLHDCWAFTGHCVHFTYAGCDKWKENCGACTQKKEYPASWLMDRCRQNYADKKRIFCDVPNMTIVTVSQWLKQVTGQSFLGGYPIRCVYNGIDTGIFHPVANRVKQELGIEGKKMILLVSDGWTNQKGYSRALDAAKQSPTEWHFVMIGLSPRQIKDLPGNIIGIQRIWNRDNLIEYYSAADVFLNLSVEETFGLVTAEALACGTPVVVYNSTACPEPAADQQCGLIVETSATIDEILDAVEKASRLKTGKPLNVFSLQESVENVISLYK